MSSWPDIRLSKFLSLVLRHRPEALGVSLDPGGWADLDELLSRMAEDGIPVDEERLRGLIRRQAKPRFTLDDDARRIRANYGHSLPVELDLEPEAPPEHLYHGTATRSLGSILAGGLEGKGRRHVHLSRDPEAARRVGTRHGSPAVLRIQAGRMHDDGWAFRRPAPGIWLVDRVPPQYLERLPS